MLTCVRLFHCGHSQHEIAIPSAALPASGSLGIISARNIEAPLALKLLRAAQRYAHEIEISKKSFLQLPKPYLRHMLSVDEFLSCRKHLPVIDVRSEGEYAQGHVPEAINIPILNNEERKIVGTLYKQQGPKQAIKEGVRLVGPRLIQLLEAAEAVSAGREVLVHCWRGGMRSNNFCWLIERLGIKANPLQGGYKAYRSAVLESFRTPLQLIVLSGNTGSGKTELLEALRKAGEQVICLETLARHKGSAFGGLGMEEQPSTEQFQNNLFEEIIGLDVFRKVWVEDESIAVGKIFLPEPFWRNLRGSPIVKVEVPKEVRVERLVKDYGVVDKQLLLQSMQQITKRLGGQHFNTAKEALFQNDLATTAAVLLTYYDKAYDKAFLPRESQLIASMPFDWTNPESFVKHLTTLNLEP